MDDEEPLLRDLCGAYSGPLFSYAFRATGDRHGLDLPPAGPGLGQGVLDQRVEPLEMGPGGQLRDHPAEPIVDLVLAGEDVREHLLAVLDDGDGRLVAGRLDPEDPHGGGRTPRGTSSMIRSSCSW
jgi:hypothetical protein